MKLRELAAGDLSGLVLDEVLKNSVLLNDHVEFYTGAGNAKRSRKTNDSTAFGGARSLEEDYTPKSVSPSYGDAGRKIFGGEVKMDVAYERFGSDIPSEFALRLRKEAKQLARYINNLIINGNATTNAEEFNGLKALCPTGQRMTAGGANGLQVVMGNDNAAKKAQQEFLETLDAAILANDSANKALLMNGKQIARLNSIAREYIQWTIDSFGRRIVSYNTTPIVNMDEAGVNILPQTETVGTSTDCSSLYVAGFEEEDGISFFSNKGGFYVYPMEREGVFYKTSIELIADSILLRDKAIVRLEGLRF